MTFGDPSRSQGLDQQYMAMAIRLARKGLNSTTPNPRVGCVLLKDGNIVGSGWHQRAGEAHAEINALEQAGENAEGATAYVTLEPCCHQGRTGPCSQALIRAGVGRVVVAMLDPNPQVSGKGMQQLDDAGISTSHGVLEDSARALNPGFISRMQNKRPWVYSKLAVSLDGHTAMADGQSQWITSEQARQDVQHWRARSCALLTGVGTILSDDPSLNVRLETERQPIRMILDSDLKTPVKAKCLSLEGRTLIFTCSTDQVRYDALQQAGAEVLHLERDKNTNKVDLSQLMQVLAKMEINELMVEAGATLNGALLEAGLMDQCLIYMAPHFMGSQTRPMLQTSGLKNMADRVDMQINEIRQVGPDLRITAKPKSEA